MFAVGLNLWLNFRLRLWESNWNTQIPECNLVSLDWCRGTRGTRLGLPYCWSRIRRCWSTKSESTSNIGSKMPEKSSIRVGKFFGTSLREKCAHQHGFLWLFRTLLRLTLRGLFNSKSLPICIVEVESVDVGRQRVNQRRISVQKCLKKVQLELASFLAHLWGKSVPINMAFCDFSAPCCDWPFEVSLILNLFQSVLLKSNPSMLVDKEWINVEYRFKIVWRRLH